MCVLRNDTTCTIRRICCLHLGHSRCVEHTPVKSTPVLVIHSCWWHSRVRCTTTCIGSPFDCRRLFLCLPSIACHIQCVAWKKAGYIPVFDEVSPCRPLDLAVSHQSVKRKIHPLSQGCPKAIHKKLYPLKLIGKTNISSALASQGVCHGQRAPWGLL